MAARPFLHFRFIEVALEFLLVDGGKELGSPALSPDKNSMVLSGRI